MRACATASAVVTGLFLGAAVFAACTGGSSPATAPPLAASETKAAAAPPPAVPGDVLGGDAGQDGAPADESPRTAAVDPSRAFACASPVSVILAEPVDGGVVMNNATTSGDAGATDRLAALLELVQSQRDRLRCCFDLWAARHPGEPGSAVLLLDLAPDGALRRAALTSPTGPAETSDGGGASDVEACVVALARSLTYPPSPSGKDTVYTHRFQFEVRR